MTTAPFPIPDEALAQHAALLGKTGSGKTSTAKVIVEHLVAQGARVCILDPIKSDWWGLTSSFDGKSPGLPFHILGGPRGHVPLHAGAGAAVAEIVASGALPLSILDMRFFGPGDHARFFIDFAPTLLNRMKGVVHLVLEEAHLFAPKERSGIGNENLAIHYAKALATAGRSTGIRLILATQRVQALHNALLGSCETMVAHRLTAPADQKPLIDWLKANVQKDIAAEVAGSLSSLRTGTGWVCSGEAKFFERIEFPRITTFDNSATPTGDLAEVKVRTAPVDVDRLRAIMAEVAPSARSADGVQAPSSGQIEAARQAGYDEGYRQGFSEGKRLEWRRHMEESHARHMAALAEIMEQLGPVDAPVDRRESEPPSLDEVMTPTPRASAHARAPSKPPESGVLGLVQAAARVHPAAMTWGQVATLAGRKPRGGHFNTCRKGALDQGLLTESDGLVRVTEAGLARAGVEPPEGPIADVWSRTLPQPAAKMFDTIRDRPGITVIGLASILRMQPSGGHWNTGMATLKRNDLIRDDGGKLSLAGQLR